MFSQDVLQQFKKNLQKAKSILVLLPPDPGEQLINAALGLYYSLKNSSKEVQIGCSGSHLPEPIKSSIGSKNLILNFKYKEEDLDKVDYDVDAQGNFQLLIKPKLGSSPPDSGKVTFTYTGADADMVIVLGINSLEELGRLYSEEKKFLDQAVISSINKNPKPANFATYNFHTGSVSSIIEIVAFILAKTKILPPQETANNLLKDIYSSSNNLNSPRLTAETFETVAFLIRNGATPPFSTSPSHHIPLAPTFNNPDSLEKIPPAQVPSDWKKPKIFRSTSSNGLDRQ